MKGILKTGLIVLSTVGSVVSTGAVVNQVVSNSTTESTVVEEYNYVNEHIINISDNYTIVIDGEETTVTYEEWAAVKQKYETLDSAPFTFYYGAVDVSNPSQINTAAMTEVNLTYTPKTYVQNIKAGNTSTESGQYPVVVIPSEYTAHITCLGQEMFKLYTDNGTYRVYIYDGTATYDIEDGGINYTISLVKNN